MSSQSILEDYRLELAHANAHKARGVIAVTADVAGEKLAAGRATVSIDEYIAHWQDGITAMEAGADQELYNY